MINTSLKNYWNVFLKVHFTVVSHENVLDEDIYKSPLLYTDNY